MKVSQPDYRSVWRRGWTDGLNLMAKTPAKKTPSKRKAPAKKKPAAKRTASKPSAKTKPAKDFKVKLDRKEPRGLFAHIFEARRGLRASFDAQMKQGLTEERLLFYVAFACLMAFVARMPTVISASEASEGQISTLGLVAGSFVAFVILAPLFLYGLAGLSHLVSLWAFGGKGSYPAARLALFWSLVLVIPIGLGWALVVQGLRLSGLDAVIEPVGLLVFAFWLWIWTSFLAMSEGFSRIKCFLFVIASMACLAGLLKLAAG